MDFKKVNLKSLFFSNITTKQTVVKNTFWLTFSTIIADIISFFFVAYVARVFPVAEYGKFNYALGIVSFLIILADLGISSIATREIAKDVSSEKRYLGSLFSLKLILSLATFLLAIIIAPIASSEPRVQHVIWLISVYLLASQFISLFYALFQAHQKMEYQAFGNVAQVVLYAGLGFAIINSNSTIFTLGAVYLFGTLVTLLAMFLIYTKRFSHVVFSFDTKTWKWLLSVSWPVALIGIFGTVYHSLDSVMLGAWGFMEANGLYTAAYKIFDIALVPLSLISTSFFPVFSKVFAHDIDKPATVEEKGRVFNPQLSSTIILGVPIVAGGILFAQQIITLIFGAKYTGGTLALQILMGALLVIYVSNPFVSALFAGNFQKTTFWVTVGGGVLNAILNVILIPSHTLNGAAFATFVTYLVDMVAMTILAKKLLGITLFNRNFLKVFLAALAATGLMSLVITLPAIKSLSVIYIVLLGALVYAIALFGINKLFRLKLF